MPPGDVISKIHPGGAFYRKRDLVPLTTNLKEKKSQDNRKETF